MHTFAKKRLHSAIAAALVGIGSAAMTGQALAQETNVGQTLVFPYYTVNNGWVTTFKAINTTDNALAVKVRFHESKNSRDVLDFNVIMSPSDVWSGWIQEGEDGAPQFFTSDASCTSPLNVSGSSASDVAYTGSFADGGGTGQGRMREGYVEMIVMGYLPNALIDAQNGDDSRAYPTAYYAEHVDGVPRDCARVDERFIAESPEWVEGDTNTNHPADNTYRVVLDCGDGNVHDVAWPSVAGSGAPLASCDFFTAAGVFPLKGNLSWLHAGTGTGAGTEAIAVGTAFGIDWHGALPNNSVTAQQYPWFLEPTFASTNGLWTVSGVGTYENLVTFGSTLNEWADNAANGATVDWVVNFPTKGYHVDKFNDQIQAAVSKYRLPNLFPTLLAVVANGTGGPYFSNSTQADECNSTRSDCDDQAPVLGGLIPTVAPFDYLFDVQGEGDSTLGVTYNLYDSEEGGQAIGSTTISPAPPGEIEALRWETNVVQFGLEPVVDSPKAVVVDASTLLSGAVNGWAELQFDTPVPIVSFAIKERDRGEPSTAYGQAMDNGYKP